MKRVKVLSDYVKATFHYLGRTRFPADVPRIHKAFHAISQKPEFSLLFGNFVFDTSKAYPHCPTIRYALDRLQKANLLSCINPGLDEFEVSKALADQKQDIDVLFSEQERQALKGVAEEFKKEMRQ